jgi:HEAT repeat protein
VREAAALILGRLKDSAKTIPALVKCLSDENWILRSSAAAILGRIGVPAIGALYKVLEGGDDDARFWAIRALGTIGDSAIDPLVGYLGDKSWIIRRNAAEALIEIGDAAAKPLLRRLEGVEDDGGHFVYWSNTCFVSPRSGAISSPPEKPGDLARGRRAPSPACPRPI